MNICIFASGRGSNFQAILNAKSKGLIHSNIKLFITNNSKCAAAEIARNNKIDIIHISRKAYPSLTEDEYDNLFISVLKKYQIDLVVLAGYMKKINSGIIREFKNRIINIHPALLPSFGGENMFGLNVHKAVIESGVKVSGLTIHFVNENYDNGKIIFQKCVDVEDGVDEFSLQKKILNYEHECYPEIIRRIEKGLITIGIQV
ncbi:MAG TPA: phosphoribosylglycinamide formyltransferase [Ignavibacteria bacterium]